MTTKLRMTVQAATTRKDSFSVVLPTIVLADLQLLPAGVRHDNLILFQVSDYFGVDIGSDDVIAGRREVDAVARPEPDDAAFPPRTAGFEDFDTILAQGPRLNRREDPA